MSIQSVTIGPFTKGITNDNLADVNSPDTALDIVNFDPMIDGSLVSRRPQLSSKIFWQRTGMLDQNVPIGYFQDPVLGLYIIFNTPTGIYFWNKRVSFTGFGGSSGWLGQLISTTNRANVAVQYRDKLWIVAYEGTSGYWTPATGFVTVNGMPLGNSAAIKNDRLFITGITSESKLEWSDVGDFTKWYGAGGGYVAIKQSDGHYLQKVVNYNDQLVVFKNRGVWVLNYSSDPGQGSLRLISPIVGTDNCFSAASRDDYVVTYSSGKIYRINANSLDLLSPTYANTLNNYSRNNVTSSTNYTSMFELNSFVTFVDSDKIIIFVEGKYLVWNILNECWTRYEFTEGEEIGLILEVPSFDDRSANTYFCGGLTFNNTDTYELVGQKTVFENDTAYIPFYASITSKPIDFGTAASFKRLFHWGVDCIFGGTVTGTISPVTVTSTIWSSLSSNTWDSLSANNWNTPLVSSVSSVTVTSNNNQREYVKFPKSSRFRRINFKVEFYRQANYCTFYTINAFVKAKQLVFARES
jgi:hypothetical protein